MAELKIIGGNIEVHSGSSSAPALTLDRGDAAQALLDHHRLRGALEKIAKGYPCGDVRSMRRLAAEALGIEINLPSI